MTDRSISLDDIRLRLNDLDDELLKLLSERRKLSIEVAKSKVETSKPVRGRVLSIVFWFPTDVFSPPYTSVAPLDHRLER